MLSRKVVAGASVLGALALVAFYAAFQGADTTLAVALSALVTISSALGLATLMTQRRTARNLALIMRKGVPKRDGDVTLSEPEVQKADLLGLVRMMQAQYLGRLDRAQDSLDRAVARILDDSRAESATRPAFAERTEVLSLSVIGEQHGTLIDEAIKLGVPVVITSDDSDVDAWIERQGWSQHVFVERRETRIQEQLDDGSVSAES